MAGLIGNLLKMALNRNGRPAKAKPKQKVPPMIVRTKGKFAPKKGKRVIVRSDGDGNQRLGHSVGRRVGKLAKRTEYKIRDSLNPVDSAVFETAGSEQTHIGQCRYLVAETGSTSDIRAVIDNLAASGKVDVAAGYNGKFYIKGMTMQHKFMNQTNGLINVRIYEYVARANPMPTTLHGSTQDAVNNGWVQQGISAGQIVIDQYRVSGTLFNNPTFTNYYKIVKVRNVQMAPGKEMVLTLGHQSPKVINMISQANTYSPVIGGFTKGYCIQYWGQPCNDASEMGVQVCTTTIAKLTWQQSRRYSYQEEYNIAGRTFQLSANLPSIPNAGAFHFMSQVNGVPENQVQA
ncbi:Cap [Chicken proventriculitis-associated circular virus 3]|nr:Cap [Chicken proventriculitis-associated circular virus 3]